MFEPSILKIPKREVKEPKRRRLGITRKMLETLGYTQDCKACIANSRGTTRVHGHSEACRERIESRLREEGDKRLARAEQRKQQRDSSADALAFQADVENRNCQTLCDETTMEFRNVFFAGLTKFLAEQYGHVSTFRQDSSTPKGFKQLEKIQNTKEDDGDGKEILTQQQRYQIACHGFTCSRSWKRHGHAEALRQFVTWAWEQHTVSTGARCHVKGLFPCFAASASYSRMPAGRKPKLK